MMKFYRFFMNIFSIFRYAWLDNVHSARRGRVLSVPRRKNGPARASLGPEYAPVGACKGRICQCPAQFDFTVIHHLIIVYFNNSRNRKYLLIKTLKMNE